MGCKTGQGAPGCRRAQECCRAQEYRNVGCCRLPEVACLYAQLGDLLIGPEVRHDRGVHCGPGHTRCRKLQPSPPMMHLPWHLLCTLIPSHLAVAPKRPAFIFIVATSFNTLMASENGINGMSRPLHVDEHIRSHDLKDLHPADNIAPLSPGTR